MNIIWTNILCVDYLMCHVMSNCTNFDVVCSRCDFCFKSVSTFCRLDNACKVIHWYACCKNVNNTKNSHLSNKKDRLTSSKGEQVRKAAYTFIAGAVVWSLFLFLLPLLSLFVFLVDFVNFFSRFSRGKLSGLLGASAHLEWGLSDFQLHVETETGNFSK